MASASLPEPAAGSPRTWFVASDKRGDNAQVEAVLPHLDWPVERRFVQMKPEWVFGKPRVRPTLDHLDLGRSDALEPPWPDLILTVGRRPSMVSLWIREKSGGRTRIVLFGKPSTRLEHFDLVVTSAENQLPPLAHVMTIGLPLMRVDEAAIAAEAARWKPRLEALPRPLVALLAGGPTGPFAFDERATQDLLALAQRVIERGGTPYLSTSRRTPPEVAKALDRRLPSGVPRYWWSAAAAADDNPYRALLGSADGFVVTADSVSMLVEVARLGRPLAIARLPSGALGSLDLARRALTRRLFEERAPADGTSLRVGLARALYRARLVTQTRDFSGIHSYMVDRGLAVWADPGRYPDFGTAGAATAPDDVGRVAGRLRELAHGAWRCAS